MEVIFSVGRHQRSGWPISSDRWKVPCRGTRPPPGSGNLRRCGRESSDCLGGSPGESALCAREDHDRRHRERPPTEVDSCAQCRPRLLDIPTGSVLRSSLDPGRLGLIALGVDRAAEQWSTAPPWTHISQPDDCSTQQDRAQHPAQSRSAEAHVLQAGA